VGKIAEKAVCKSVFMTIWHNKNALLQTVFWRFCPLGLAISALSILKHKTKRIYLVLLLIDRLHQIPFGLETEFVGKLWYRLLDTYTFVSQMTDVCQSVFLATWLQETVKPLTTLQTRKHNCY